MLEWVLLSSYLAIVALILCISLVHTQRRRNIHNNRRLLRAYYDDTLRCSICASQARLLKCGIILEHERVRPRTHECNTAELSQEQANDC